VAEQDEKQMSDSSALKLPEETWEQSVARRIASDKPLVQSLLGALKEDTVELSELQSAVNARRKQRVLRTAGA
jgi:hypothetical protein